MDLLLPDLDSLITMIERSVLTATFSIVCITLGLAFVHAGLAKLKSFTHFRLFIAEFDFVPAGMVGILSISIVALECLFGASLLVGWSVNIVLFACLCFSGALSTISHISRDTIEKSACFCFGHDGVLANSWKSAIRTFLILGGTSLALVIWYLTPNLEPLPISIETILTAFVVVLLCSWFSDIPDLLITNR